MKGISYNKGMLLVERHYTKGTPEIVRLCRLSKELYNRANFLMRQAWFSQQHLKFKTLPDINVLIQETKDLECFKQLHNTKTAKQTIRKVLTDWSKGGPGLYGWGRVLYRGGRAEGRSQ
jgi:hypothetical protein